MKEDAATLELRAQPRPVKRLNRKTIMALIGGLGLAVILTMMWGLRPPQPKPDSKPVPQAKERAANPPRPEGLAALPKDYSAVPRPVPPDVPALGPPLGELGRPILKAQRAARASSGQITTNAAPFFQLKELEQSRALVSADTSIDALAQAPGQLETPKSPWQLMAGTIIRAALITAIDSDLPGQVLAAVIEPVYDTITGNTLLIPQGSRLIGAYESDIAFAQHRVHLAWNRLILPDGSSVTFDNFTAVDSTGRAGISDSVDHHWRRTFSGAALSSVLGIAAELAAPERSDGQGAVIISARESAQEAVNELGQELTRRNLDVKPTLTVRPGFPINVLVQKDLILRPYTIATARVAR